VVAFYVPITLSPSGLPPVLTYRDTQGDSSGHTGAHTYTCAFGPADPNRYILIGGALLGSPLMTIVSIGGVSPGAALVSASDLATQQACWFMAKVPTGTSGSVVTSSSGTNWIGAVVCYSLIATNPLLIDTSTTTANPGLLPISVVGGGVVACVSNGYATTSTWSGGVTQDSGPFGSVGIMSASTPTNTAFSGTLTPKITVPSGFAPGAAVAVSFR